MPGEPGRALPPTAVEVWPSVAPFGEAGRISVSIIVLAFLCLRLAPLSPAQAARTTRGRPQLRPQDWIGPGLKRRNRQPVCRSPIRCGRTLRGRAVPVIGGRQPGTPAGRTGSPAVV